METCHATRQVRVLRWSSLVNRAWEPLIRAVRGECSTVPLESAPEPARVAGRAEPHAPRTLRLLRALRERAAAMVHPRRRRGAQRHRPASLGSLKHVTVAAFILVSGQTAAYHDHFWCTGGTKFVDMTNCVVWKEGDEFSFTAGNGFSARNTCNEYMNLTVCWTGHEFPDR